jgi:hypothetical protein
MFYCESLTILFVMLIPATVIGWRLADLLPWRLRPEARIFYSPLLGLAVVLHLAVLLGWIGHGYRQPVCLLVMVVLLLASLWGRRNVTTLIKSALLVILFAVVASAGVLYPVWRYAAINPYNDTFFYLVHGQWLQTHGFAEPATLSGNYPAITQVLVFQLVGIRMGASFMLGYIQALMGADWSYQVYPAVVAIPIVACALAVAGAAYSVCRRLSLALLCGATVGLTLNGLSYGAGNGFFAQTWGLAFVCGVLTLTGAVLRQSVVHSKPQTALGYWVPVALLLSASIHCYSPISPFPIATMGLVFLVAAIPFRRRLGRLLVLAVWLVFLCLLLVNLEWIRVARTLRTESAAVVGMAVNWPWWHFLAVAMGLRTGVQDADVYLLGKPATGPACIAGVGLVLAGLWWCQRYRGKTLQLIPHLAFLSLVFLAFVYFRYVAASPWSTGTGQSWNQFKLSNWATPSMFCLLATGIAALARKSATRSCLLSAGLLGILVAGVVCQARLAKTRTHAIREDTGLPYDPFSAFSKIHQFSAYVPKDVPIYLDMPDSLDKPREMLMYALEDHALAGDWRSDVYLSALREDQRNQTPVSCQWVVSMDSAAPPTARQAGNLWLSLCPSTLFTLQSSTGGYDREQDRTGWWHWTARQLHFTYGIIGERPQRVIVSFTHMPTSDHLPVHLSVGGRTFELSLNAGWHNWTSEPIEINHTGDTVDVVFDSDSPPVRLSERDPRLASYSIKNLTLHRVD